MPGADLICWFSRLHNRKPGLRPTVASSPENKGFQAILRRFLWGAEAVIQFHLWATAMGDSLIPTDEQSAHGTLATEHGNNRRYITIARLEAFDRESFPFRPARCLPGGAGDVAVVHGRVCAGRAGELPCRSADSRYHQSRFLGQLL